MTDKKKIILFIVEGINDKICLSLCLDQLLDKNTVRFETTDGDITTKYGNSGKNIASEIGKIVKKFSGRIFKQNDYLEVVHLVDMDGAYIPDRNIMEGNVDNNIYHDDRIETSNVEKTHERNHQKQKNLEKMISLHKVWKSIPYSVYYFSCNMDHVLHNNANLSREEKVKGATDFENKYFNKPKEFVELFRSNDLMVKGDYSETWKHIKLGTNSLKKFTNFALYLNKIKND